MRGHNTVGLAVCLCRMPLTHFRSCEFRLLIRKIREACHRGILQVRERPSLPKLSKILSYSYRLGALGFLAGKELNAAGNYGLKDQALAFKWVRILY